VTGVGYGWTCNCRRGCRRIGVWAGRATDLSRRLRKAGAVVDPGRSQPACGPAQSRERITKPSVQLFKFLAAGRTEVAKQIESAIIRHVTELDESLGWLYVRVQDRPSYAFCAGHHRRGR
jgi:hypothetical protein